MTLLARPYVIIYPVNGKWTLTCMTCPWNIKVDTPEEARIVAAVHANQVRNRE